MAFTLPGRPFSRSYGTILPSSLTRVISITLVFSTCPPVSVLVRARADSLEDFLEGMASGTRRLNASWHRVSGYAAPHLTGATPTRLLQDNHRLVPLAFPVPPSVKRLRRGTGISTCWPSTTPFGLALGPDLPWADELYPGILGQSVEGILTPLSLLMPAFSLPARPRLVYTAASIARERSPTAHPVRRPNAPAASVTSLSPVTFSALEHLTSELLRTLSRNGCL